MSHQLTDHMMEEAAYFVVWTQLRLCRRNNVFSLPRNPSWPSAGNVSLQSVSSIGPRSCITARRRTQEWWRQQGEKRTGNWAVRGKRRGKNNERKVNGKEGLVMKASAGKLKKRTREIITARQHFQFHHCSALKPWFPYSASLLTDQKPSPRRNNTAAWASSQDAVCLRTFLFNLRLQFFVSENATFDINPECWPIPFENGEVIWASVPAFD